MHALQPVARTVAGADGRAGVCVDCQCQGEVIRQFYGRSMDLG